MDADRRHETLGSETTDFVTHNKNSGQCRLLDGLLALIPIGVTWMGLNECLRMPWVCITGKKLSF